MIMSHVNTQRVRQHAQGLLTSVQNPVYLVFHLLFFMGFLSKWKSGFLFLVSCLDPRSFCLFALFNSGVLVFALSYFNVLFYILFY